MSETINMIITLVISTVITLFTMIINRRIVRKHDDLTSDLEFIKITDGISKDTNKWAVNIISIDHRYRFLDKENMECEKTVLLKSLIDNLCAIYDGDYLDSIIQFQVKECSSEVELKKKEIKKNIDTYALCLKKPLKKGQQLSYTIRYKINIPSINDTETIISVVKAPTQKMKMELKIPVDIEVRNVQGINISKNKQLIIPLEKRKTSSDYSVLWEIDSPNLFHYYGFLLQWK